MKTGSSAQSQPVSAPKRAVGEVSRSAAWRFRKRPVVIEAFRLLGPATWCDHPSWFKAACESGGARLGIDVSRQEVFAEIPTLEGVMRAGPSDWIIRGVKGELYPCKPDVFALTYESSEGDGLSHDEAIDALCGCAATVTVLSYQEAIEGYFKLRGLETPA